MLHRIALRRRVKYYHQIEVFLKKKQLSIKGVGSYLIGEHNERINYEITNKDGNLKFQSEININKNQLHIGFLNYKKKENKESILFIDGEYQKDKTLIFKKISLNESENNFLIDNMVTQNVFSQSVGSH